MRATYVLSHRQVAPAVALVALVAIWQAMVAIFAWPAFLVPAPLDVARAGIAHAGDLARAANITAQGALAGFVLSAIVGLTVGTAFSLSRFLERGLYPYALLLQTVPIVAVAPLIVLWFGPGLRAVAVSAFIVSVFPVIASTLAGMRDIDPRLLDLFRLYGAGLGDTLLKLKLPSAMPSIFTGLRVASGLSVIGAIVGEFVAGFSEGGAGLGITVLAAYRQLKTDLLFAAVLSASLLGMSLFGAVSLVAWWFLRYRNQADDAKR